MIQCDFSIAYGEKFYKFNPNYTIKMMWVAKSCKPKAVRVVVNDKLVCLYKNLSANDVSRNISSFLFLLNSASNFA